MVIILFKVPPLPGGFIIWMREGIEIRDELNYAEFIKSDKLPRHIAIIMDGNGRWARKKLMPRSMGYRAGMKALKEVVKACVEIGIPILTVFAFSTENWKRPAEEINYLMNLLVEFLHKELKELNDNNIRINILGDYNYLSEKCRVGIEKALAVTGSNSGLIFNIALNYGSRKEILRAVKLMVDKLATGEIETITEEMFSDFLFTKGLPDPDLLIRTAGEMRISNFLLWQIAYTELWFTDCLWPDFSREEFFRAIWEYQQRDRRFGGISSSNRQDEKYV